ncbi:TM0996/MTH895 family glutaredoxin-like protein [bacterium]|nr:TM0996/MTH895 family glutaredoxin-like protein [bacterium]
MKKIQILGSGCPKCQELHKRVLAAVENAGGGYEVEKVEEIIEIARFGVMMTPALVIDGDVKTVGKVPSVEEIQEQLK